MVNNSISDSGGGGNIFFTTENLAFSMPLILVCTSYVSWPVDLRTPGSIFVVHDDQVLSGFRVTSCPSMEGRWRKSYAGDFLVNDDVWQSALLLFSFSLSFRRIWNMFHSTLVYQSSEVSSCYIKYDLRFVLVSLGCLNMRCVLLCHRCLVLVAWKFCFLSWHVCIVHQTTDCTTTLHLNGEFITNKYIQNIY